MLIKLCFIAHDMNIAVIIFYALLGCYLIGLGIFVLTKKKKAKKSFEKEIKEHEEQNSEKVEHTEK